jgi:Cof subfamily protein (haloacid dehalogenase superfamily)
VQRPRLVATDIDGTLLDPLEEISERMREVGQRMVAEGTPLVLATGRPPRWIPYIADKLGVYGYAVCCNGAVLYDVAGDEVVYASQLDPVLLNDVADVLDRVLPGSALAAERVGASVRRPAEPVFITEGAYSHPWGDDNPSTVPRGELLGHRAVKLLVRNPEMTSEEMAAVATAALDDSVDVTYSVGNGLIEIAEAGITKATGVADVARRYGVPAEEVLAFGDMPNDTAMLRWAGHGVAMANGHEEVLAVADEITGSNAEDGVAEVLERWF